MRLDGQRTQPYSTPISMSHPFQISRAHLKWFMLSHVIVAIGVSTALCPRCLTTASGLHSYFVDYFLFSFLMSVLLGSGIGFIVHLTDRRVSWIRRPVLRLLLDLIGITLYSFLAAFLLFTFFGAYIWNWDIPENEFFNHVFRLSRLPVLIALGITVVLTGRSFLLQWRQAAIETQRMRAERLAGQYQTLKNQLNPHFLFNSLNVLGNLVYENPDRANEFIEKLAAIYRHVLDSQENDLISLEVELRFIRDFLELQQIRFGDRMSFTISAKDSSDYWIPPLTLQLLVENALKHNKATEENPLLISIVSTGNELTVTNRLQKREIAEPGTGIGLKNIRERYRFFTDTPIRIAEEAGQFVVTIPLLTNPNP